MAVLKDLIVHGPSRFIGMTEVTNLKVDKIKAQEGIFKKLVATDADFDSMTTNNATVVGLLDVKGELHTNSWTNSNIATIEGSFYITPTISCASGTFNYDGTNITLTAASGNSFAISSLYINNGDAGGTTIAWSAYSEVLITGQVAINNEKVPLGTIKGKITSTTPTTSKIIINSLTDGKSGTSNVLATIGTGTKTFYDIKISLLKRGNTSDTAKALPIGIYMTAIGQGGKTFIDIYGGHNAVSTAIDSVTGDCGGLAKPVLRIGNLAGLPKLSNGTQPSGYGIYTNNGYFTGTIVSTSGIIGNWSITGSSIQTGGFKTADKMYFGTSGISLGTTFSVTNAGVLAATSGTIGGITIGATYLTTNAARKTYDATTAGLTITSTGIGAGNGTSNTFKVVASTGALTAGNATLTGGAIAGWSFNATSLYKTNATPGYSAATMVISTGTKSTKNIGDGGTTEKTWMLSAGTRFGVTTEGKLYAIDAIITGKIQATSGYFKNIQIRNNNNANLLTIDGNQINIFYNSSGTATRKALVITSGGLDIFGSDTTNPIASFGTSIVLKSTSGTVNSQISIASDAITMYNNAVPVYNVNTTNSKQNKVVVPLNVFCYASAAEYTETIKLGRTVNTSKNYSVILHYTLNGTSQDVPYNNKLNISDTTNKYSFKASFNAAKTELSITLGPGNKITANDDIMYDSIECIFYTNEIVVQSTLGAYADKTIAGPFRIGKGTSENALANAMLVDYTGNIWAGGDIVAYCNNNSSGGISLAKVRVEDSAYNGPDPSGCTGEDGYLFVEIEQVGMVVMLTIRCRKTTSTSASGNLFMVDLSSSHIPTPAGTSSYGTDAYDREFTAGIASGFGYTSGYSLGFWMGYNESVGAYVLTGRNLHNTTAQPLGVSATITYVWNGINYTDEIE